MIKQIYNKITLPIYTRFLLRKHGGIWGLKEYLKKIDKPNAKILRAYDNYFMRSGSWVGYNSQIDSAPCFPHGCTGVFVSGGAKIGRNVVIFQHVTIGSNTLNDSNNTGSPTIGDSVYIGAGAKIIGNIKIGNNCRIGANAVVYQDMQPNSVAVVSSTRLINKENLDNRFYSQRNGKWVFYN